MSSIPRQRGPEYATETVRATPGQLDAALSAAMNRRALDGWQVFSIGQRHSGKVSEDCVLVIFARKRLDSVVDRMERKG